MAGKLQEIHITGFKTRFSTMSLKFTNENVTVIYGDNGCGKTTLLRVLHAIFTKNDNELLKNKIESIRLKFSTTKTNKDSGQKNVIIKKKSNSDKYIWPESINFSSLGLGVGRTINSTETNIQINDIYRFFVQDIDKYKFVKVDKATHPGDWFDFCNDLLNTSKKYREFRKMHEVNLSRFNEKNLYLKNVKIEEVVEMLLENYRVARIKTSKRIQNALFETLSSYLIATQPRFDDYHHDMRQLYQDVSINKARIISALDDNDDNKTKTEIVNKLKAISSFQTFINEINTPILIELFSNMVDELVNEQSMLNSINEIVSIFNQHMPTEKYLYVSETGLEIITGDDSHSVTELSSGESQLLITLCMLVLKGRDKDIILIDEPELSFNIKWQRKFVELVTYLVPDSQVIVASHSPAIAGSSKYKTTMNVDIAGAL
ncbi:AAA family ATPase [Vibrio parahaemolyticus]|uniref:AAA family ATPase n=1 Tax=Vibrio parahaemolyticus TaxID=670 RepID=UPI0028783192|nr:AAA family ATPase [Vibrio parahaemolyticus]MDS1792752.1 AAA family ATPase [Vibrio parahaemolyticus]MDS1795052.1 AAA family ATPase [Vibrio parahaemolyticus]MDS1941296.1 AAA family ATPase [Vibrio parahaemolyticus]